MSEAKMKVRYGGELSWEAKILAELAPKASMAVVREAWAHGLSVMDLEGEDIFSIAPDGTKTFVKKLEPIK